LAPALQKVAISKLFAALGETRKAHLAHEVHAAESNSKSKSYKPDTWTFWTSPFDHHTLFSGTVGDGVQ